MFEPRAHRGEGCGLGDRDDGGSMEAGVTHLILMLNYAYSEGRFDRLADDAVGQFGLRPRQRATK